MFSPDQYIQQIRNMAHGAARLDAINNAITEADAASAHEWRFYFRREYINESVFHGDSFKAIICFPELLQIVDEHPEVEADNEHELMWTFKNVLENTFDFYQISREEIENYFDEFDRRSRKYGLTQRVYHMKKCKFYLAADPDKVKESYEAFHRARRDSNSDCLACEMNFDMRVALALGDVEEALHIAQPLLEGKRSCGEVPHVTYAYLSRYYLYQGDLEEASYYGSRCERLIGNEPEFLEQMGTLLELYSAVNPSHGWKLFKQSLENFMECRNPLMRMNYALGAHRLLQAILNLTEEEEHYSQSAFVCVLPLEVTEKGVSMEAMHDYFYQIAKEQSEKLDARNGNSYYMDLLNTELKTAEEADLSKPKASVHGIVQKRPTLVAVTLPEGICPTLEELAERIKANVPDDAELVTAEADEEDLRVVLRRDGRIFEAAVMQAEIPEMPARPVAGMEEAALAQMMENPKRYLLNAELGDSPLTDYALIMKLISTLLPEMTGLVDLQTQHAYPAEWVQFVGTYPDGVSPHDLFGLYLTGSEELNEVWMTTIGLWAIGMRELEIIGADTENFSIYADMLDNAAAQVVEKGFLPDAGQPIADCYYGDTPYSFTWNMPEPYIKEGTVAAGTDRGYPTAALLVQEDDGEALPPLSKVSASPEDISYPNSNAAFYRRIRLAKAAFEIFRKAVQKPFERAAARLEFEMDDDTAEEYGYGIELLWAEVSRIEGDKIFARVAETSEALPDVKEGDEVEITADAVAAWFVQPEGYAHPVGESEAYVLWKETQI